MKTGTLPVNFLGLLQLANDYLEDSPPELCTLYPLQTSNTEPEIDDIIECNGIVQEKMLRFTKIHQCHNNVICAAFEDYHGYPLTGETLGSMRRAWGIENAHDMWQDIIPPAVVS